MSNVAPRRTFDLANTALRGQLAEILQAKRSAGRTFDQIAHDLAEEGVLTSRETIRRWCQDLDISPEPEAKAS